jgi:hypothetical protein
MWPGAGIPLYLIHGLGWNNREWTQIRHADVVMDNLIADGKASPMVIIFPNGDSTMTLADIEANGNGPRMNPGNAQHVPAAVGGGAVADAGRGGRQGMSMSVQSAVGADELALGEAGPVTKRHGERAQY